MTSFFTESIVEQAAIEWISELGYSIKFGPDIAVDGTHPERSSYGEVILVNRLRNAVAKINPKVPAAALEDAVRKVTAQQFPGVVASNHVFQKDAN
jgi:type I restriction enzyme R subunit